MYDLKTGDWLISENLHLQWTKLRPTIRGKWTEGVQPRQIIYFEKKNLLFSFLISKELFFVTLCLQDEFSLMLKLSDFIVKKNWFTIDHSCSAQYRSTFPVSCLPLFFLFNFLSLWFYWYPVVPSITYNWILLSGLYTNVSVALQIIFSVLNYAYRRYILCIAIPPL
jgi:hypothetical protein